MKRGCQAAMFTQYWSPKFEIATATFLLLMLILLMNACGVRVSMAGSARVWERADLHSCMATLSGHSNGLKFPS